MSSNSCQQSTPSCGVDKSTYQHPSKQSTVHPHNLLQDPSVIASKLEAANAMNIIKNNIHKWKTEDINEPGFKLTNFDPYSNPCFNGVEEPEIEPTVAQHFDKSESDTSKHPDATVSKSRFNSNSSSVRQAIEELMKDIKKEEIELKFRDVIDEEVVDIRSLKHRNQSGLEIMQAQETEDIIKHCAKRNAEKENDEKIKNDEVQEAMLQDLNQDCLVNDYLVLSGVKKTEPTPVKVSKKHSGFADCIGLSRFSKPVSHPVNLKEIELSGRVLKDIWSDISDKIPEYTEAKDIANYYKKNTVTEPITFLETWAYNDKDILELSGIDSNNVEEDEMQQDFRIALLRYITNDELPEGCNLGLNEKTLCVNGAPTKISSKAIEMAFCGLAELVGPKKSIELVGKIVSRKLKKVF